MNRSKGAGDSTRGAPGARTVGGFDLAGGVIAKRVVTRPLTQVAKREGGPWYEAILRDLQLDKAGDWTPSSRHTSRDTRYARHVARVAVGLEAASWVVIGGSTM